MDSGMTGGIVGSAIGIAGGLFGAYCSIKSTKGPKEREFVIRATVICFLAVAVFLACLFLLPSPYRFLLWIPYAILLPFGIVKWNRAQAQIRRDESGEELFCRVSWSDAVGGLKMLFKRPKPAGPEEVLRSFTADDSTLGQEVEVTDEGAWRVVADGPLTVRLFEVKDPEVEKCMLTYRVNMRTEDLEKRAYLEMWCRLPGKGEFFSKGLDNAVTGTTDWEPNETPFFLQAGQKPDLVKLNVVLEGRGTLWLRNVQLLTTPLA